MVSLHSLQPYITVIPVGVEIRTLGQHWQGKILTGMQLTCVFI